MLVINSLFYEQANAWAPFPIEQVCVKFLTRRRSAIVNCFIVKLLNCLEIKLYRYTALKLYSCKAVGFDFQNLIKEEVR